jgi:hypothetical protein
VLPYARADTRTFGRTPRILLAIVWAYPLLPLVALYITWLVAWVALGHQPQPSLDDPKHISGTVDVPYIVTGVLLITLPVGIIGGYSLGLFLTLWWVHSRGGGSARYLLATVALSALYVGAFTLLYRDPLRVLYWYMD